ncbi:MAG: hypothetical protein NTU43_11265 [Bacteroidetes bacterium]|nr:hypothetical protein [Bacteroidota bacterium]
MAEKDVEEIATNQNIQTEKLAIGGLFCFTGWVNALVMTYKDAIFIKYSITAIMFLQCVQNDNRY